MRVLCNITWRCSIGTCAYCWIYGKDGVGEGFLKESKSAEEKEELDASRWIRALNRLPGTGTVDFCGGEPTLHRGFAEIVDNLNPRYKWALTTNLATDSNVEVLESVQNDDQCVIIHCSYHKEVPFDDWLARFRWLGNIGRFPIAATFVQNPYVDYSQEVNKLRSKWNFPDTVKGISTPKYQNPQEANDTITPETWARAPASFCSAGNDHVVIAPNGDICRCLTAWRSNRRDEFMVGNLLTSELLALVGGPCNLNCDPLEVQCWEVTRRTGA